MSSREKYWRHLTTTVHDDISDEDLARIKRETADIKFRWKGNFKYEVLYKKHRIRFENTPRRIPTTCIPEFLLRQAKSMECCNPHFLTS